MLFYALGALGCFALVLIMPMIAGVLVSLLVLTQSILFWIAMPYFAVRFLMRGGFHAIVATVRFVRLVRDWRSGKVVTRSGPTTIDH